MSKTNPADRKYSREHEWAQLNSDGTVTIGITDYAQEMLTDIVFVELPAIGKTVKQMDPLAVVESVKSVSDVFAPVGGEVIEVNLTLESRPELINRDAFGEGWIAKMKMNQPEELEGLMDAAGYEAMIREQKH